MMGKPVDERSSDLTRSVNDFATDDEVEERLAKDLLAYSEKPATDQVSGTPAWMLQDYDPEAQEQTTLQKELRRLRILKSFSLVGEYGHEQLVRITSMAGRIFNAPIAIISIIDLGRVWFFASTGVDGVSEMAREVSMCGHAIMIKGDCFVIPDASKDFRFAKFPLVTGPPHVRFYAAAPLIVPEGDKIGVLCLAGPDARPEGLTVDEQTTLVDLAATIVRMLVDRRNLLASEARQKSAIASVSHEIMTPMTGLQLSLSLLQEDQDLRQKMDNRQNELVTTAVGCSDLMVRMYQRMAESLREEYGNVSSTLLTTPTKPICRVSEFFSYLKQVLEAVPMNVPVLLDVEHSVQCEAVADDFIVFRAALTFLSTACSRTKTGFVRHRIYGNGARIVFEFEDTAPVVSENDCQVLLGQGLDRDLNDLSLIPLRYATSLLNAVQGQYGFRPRAVGSGYVFWFSITTSSVSSRRDDNPNLDNELSAIPSRKENASTVSGSSHITDGIETSCFPSVDSCITSIAQTGSTALVIDDSLVVRKCVGRMLSSLRCQVATAENGLEGLRCMTKQRFDVVLCDFLMPVMDGFDCVRQFRFWERENRPLSCRQFIIGISAHASGNDSHEGLKAGMDLFVSKPITPSLLKDLIVRKEHKQVPYLSEESGESPIVATHKNEHVRSSAKCWYDGGETQLKPDGSLVVSSTCKQPTTSISLPQPVVLGIHHCLSAAGASESKGACNTALDKKGWEYEMIAGGDEGLAKLQRRSIDTTLGQLPPADCVPRLECSESQIAPNTVSGGVPTTCKASRESGITKPKCQGSPGFQSTCETSNTVVVTPKLVGIRRCLLATTDFEKYGARREALNKEGWECEMSADFSEMIRKLQLLNWDTVVVDATLGSMSPADSVRQFREWEGKHRISRQSNIFLDWSDGDFPVVEGNKFARFVQPPWGFDGVLMNAADWENLHRTVDSHGSTGLSSAHMIMR